MVLVLDAGALIALDGPDRRVASVLRRAGTQKVIVRVGAGVVAQVWRNGKTQANLARALNGMSVAPIDEHVARRIGELLATTGRRDVVDAHCALLVNEGDTVLTSDPKDLRQLLFARGVKARIEVV